MIERMLVDKYPASLSFSGDGSGVCSRPSPEAPQGNGAPDAHGGDTCSTLLLTRSLALSSPFPSPSLRLSFLPHYSASLLLFPGITSQVNYLDLNPFSGSASGGTQPRTCFMTF